MTVRELFITDEEVEWSKVILKKEKIPFTATGNTLFITGTEIRVEGRMYEPEIPRLVFYVDFVKGTERKRQDQLFDRIKALFLQQRQRMQRPFEEKYPQKKMQNQLQQIARVLDLDRQEIVAGHDFEEQLKRIESYLTFLQKQIPQGTTTIVQDLLEINQELLKLLYDEELTLKFELKKGQPVLTESQRLKMLKTINRFITNFKKSVEQCLKDIKKEPLTPVMKQNLANALQPLYNILSVYETIFQQLIAKEEKK